MHPTPNLDRCLAFINCQTQPPEALPKAAAVAVARRAVTLSRQAGCGALAIAEELRNQLTARNTASETPWTIFDHNLLEQILADHHLPQRLAKFMPEDRVSWMADTMEELFGLHPSVDVLVRQTAETILRLGQLGNVIIIGRGANVITAGLPQVLHVRLVGSVEKRLKCLCAKLNLSRDSAAAVLRKQDEGRRRYLRTYYHADIENPLLYHLTINTDSFAPAEAGRLIANALLPR